MRRNSILDEVHATRSRLLDGCKGDVHVYVEEARRRTLASGRKIAVIPPRHDQAAPSTTERTWPRLCVAIPDIDRKVPMLPAGPKPWYQVVIPRADLRDNRPLNASEFAVHLDHIREPRTSVSPDYLDPARFFDRIYPTSLRP
ncbi:MAG: hypothetical protein WD060_04910 [Pirellulales bacterium]